MNEFIFLNDGDAEDEAALGATDVFGSLQEAMHECEHWVSEEPRMRFYDVRGERLIAIDHGNYRSFHFERSGTFFEGFEDLVKREAQRWGVSEMGPDFSVEAALREMWERDQWSRREKRGCLAWFLPPRSFREKYGVLSWYIPALRKEPSGK